MDGSFAHRSWVEQREGQLLNRAKRPPRAVQGQFFYSFDLDTAVPPDHPVRAINTVLDLGWVPNVLAPYYSHTGQPSAGPELIQRMLILGHLFAIRSERQLCRKMQVHLAYHRALFMLGTRRSGA
jgi:transposase